MEKKLTGQGLFQKKIDGAETFSEKKMTGQELFLDRKMFCPLPTGKTVGVSECGCDPLMKKLKTVYHAQV